MSSKNVIICVLDGKSLTIENDDIFFAGYRNMYKENKDGYGLQLNNYNNEEIIKDICFKIWNLLDELNKEIKL